MDNQVTVAVVGAGNRGREVYGEYIKKHPGDITAVAVAEPNKDRRETFAQEHNIPPNYQFKGWEDLFDQERLAEGIIIATLDNLHLEPTLEAMKKGYQILLEKPIAPNWQDVKEIVSQAQEEDSQILVAHVLRYTNFFQKLKEILDKKIIGDIRYVDYIENIGFYHFAHSYVRGNWRNTEIAAPIILAKSCHDLDLIYWLLGNKCKKLTSHASLACFTEENQPDKAADRCLECSIEEDCPYSACKIYLGEDTSWPTSVISTDLSYQGRYQALKDGPYGRCVWKCDNNVPEVQRVNMTLENSTEVNFTLTGFSDEINRTIKFFGTRGELRCDFAAGVIEVYKFGEFKNEIQIPEAVGGHGGGDTGLMNQFVKLLQDDNDYQNLTSLQASVESHQMAFAAEEAREKDKVMTLDEFH